GDIYSGLVAKRLGLPIDRLCIASNVNDILTRTLATGRYEVRSVVATTSPSMDIQVSSNFERLLHGATGANADTVRRWMASLSQSGAFEIDAASLAAIRADFDAAQADEEETAAAIGDIYRTTGFLADPHTGVGLKVARQMAHRETPMVTLATAHAAKFPDAVEAATGVAPRLPARLAGIVSAQERFDVLANDGAAVEELILARSRAVKEGVS
ncbi:MAG: threonine synthase, partial [Alphaproteobacteria bacterium]